jgi:hypothetical protein
MRGLPDLTHCSELIIAVSMYEHEKAGETSDTWPAPVRTEIARQLAAWQARNPDRLALCSKAECIDRVCQVTIHHQSRSACPPGGADAGTAPPVGHTMAAPAAPQPGGGGE